MCTLIFLLFRRIQRTQCVNRSPTFCQFTALHTDYKSADKFYIVDEVAPKKVLNYLDDLFDCKQTDHTVC